MYMWGFTKRKVLHALILGRYPTNAVFLLAFHTLIFQGVYSWILVPSRSTFIASRLLRAQHKEATCVGVTYCGLEPPFGASRGTSRTQ